MAEQDKAAKPEKSDKPAAPVSFNPAVDVLSGGNIRGEVAGCPTGLSGGLLLPNRDGDQAPGAKQPDNPPPPPKKD